MEITISSDTDKIPDKHKILWRLHAVKTYRAIGLYFFGGILLIVIGSIGDYSFKTFSDKTVTYNLNFTHSFGVALILLSIIYLYHTFKARSKYFDSLDRQLYQEPNAFISNMIINETGVCTAGKDIKQEMKWTLFTHYKLYKHYLLLIMDDISLYSIVINMKELDNNAASELLAFAKRKLVKK